MDFPRSCPADGLLRSLVSGRLAESDSQAIHDHLVVCVLCRRRVDSLETEILPDAGEPLSVASRLLPETEQGLSKEGSGEETVDRDDTLDLDFLEPSADGRSMGRLGAYAIHNVLGEGGMGIVFRAFDETLHRVVAIKVLAPRLASSQKARRRFIREARAAAAINAPNIVTIHAVSIEHETPYLVMEYISGRSLRQRIRQGPPLALAEILRIGMQIATGLSAAHEHGVIHRDIKPANIMLEDDIERVKITDFGLALAAMDRSGITSFGQVIGTPAYMSPEQISGGTVDARSDLFSLGCVAYAMATGHSPFQGAHTLDVLRKVSDEKPRPLEEVDSRIPRELSSIVDRLLAKDPAQRPQSAAEVESLLKQLLARANLAESELREVPPAAAPTPPPRRRRAWVLAIPAAMLAALSIGLVLIFRSPDVERPGPGGPSAGGATQPVAVPKGSQVLKVAQSGQGDVTSIHEALARAGPGSTIRILDRATYRESLVVDDQVRLRGLTLESKEGATIVSNGGSPLTVVGTSGVTVRGLRLVASESQHSLVAEGAISGLTLEEVSFTQTPHRTHHPAAVRILSDPSSGGGTAVLIRRCRIENDGLGLGLLNRNEENKAVGGLRLEDNVFTGTGVHVLLWGPVRNVAVVGNRFLGGINGVNLNFFKPGQAEQVVIANNTFFGTTYWLGLVKTEAQNQGITICNNLILDSRKVEWGWEGQVEEVAAAWDFRANWWEPSARTEMDQFPSSKVAEAHPAIALRSRDPSDREFLRPEPGSPLASAGAGNGFPAYIGALAPLTSPAH